VALVAVNRSEPSPPTGRAPAGSLQALGSTHWWRVAALRPRLRGHVRIHRHAYRGRPWFVIEDRIAGKFYRFNFAVYRLIDLFDGRSTLQAIWDRLSAPTQPAGELPTQDEIVQVLGQLHQADLLQVAVTPDLAELLQRRGQQRRRQFMSRWLNPMSLRWRLLDPDRLLTVLARALGPLLGWPAVLLWLVVVLPALALVPAHWPDLTENFGEQLLGVDNLLVMAVVFPLLKAAHELAHGLAVRRLGGEVHEMGLMLLVFYPVPYVDASAASAFADKRDRVLVGAAGMVAELFLAALAFCAWLLLEPGLARAAAYNAVVVGGLSTVLFNANPLLRFDGYYMLMDAIEVPNLGQRANAWWLRGIEQRLFGVPASAQPQQPPPLPGERAWFIAYAPTALVYRLSVSLGIALFIASEYFFFGVAIALWTLGQGIVWPLAKGLAAVWREPRFAARGRSTAIGLLLATAAGLFGLPLPSHSVAEGVVWLPDDAILRAAGDGFVGRLHVRAGERIVPGQLLLDSVNPELAARLAEQAAKLDEARAKVDAVWGVQPARAAQLAHAVEQEQAALRRLQDDAVRLTLVASGSGVLQSQVWADLPGRHLARGEVVGWLVGDLRPVVRVVVSQSDVDPVRLATRAVQIVLPQDMATTWTARLVREVPRAGRELPSAALGTQGGGQITLDPHDDKGLTALQSVFEFELALPDAMPARYIGSRVHVRFEHPPEPLGPRGLRAVRRLFLSRFDW
jgi:putative peptide zinc metalloprotease protein